MQSGVGAAGDARFSSDAALESTSGEEIIGDGEGNVAVVEDGGWEWLPVRDAESDEEQSPSMTSSASSTVRDGRRAGVERL